MVAQLTHGADTARLRQIAHALTGITRATRDIESSGTAQLGVLLEAWLGPDTEVFAGDWQAAAQHLTHVADRLETFTKLLAAQAQQQDDASGASPGAPLPAFAPARPTGSPTAGNSTPGGRGGPWWPGAVTFPDLRTGLKVPNPGIDLPDLRANIPNPVPFFVNETKRIYRDWDESGLTWFEGMFVPWGLPKPWREKYMDTVDSATSWVNDQYVNHVADLPGVRTARWILDTEADLFRAVNRVIPQPIKAMAPYPFNTILMALPMAADEAEQYSDMLENPKGWWDNASGLDQGALAASVVPGAGILGKAAAKTTKEVADLLAGTGKHAPTPHTTPHTPAKPKSAPAPHPAKWESVNENMSERAAKYQEQVTGRPVTDAYVVDAPAGKVKFDGYDAGEFHEAKGPGYASFVGKDGKFYPWFKGQDTLVSQARRQVAAANGQPVIWHVAEPKAARAMELALTKGNVSGIIIKEEPPT